MIICHSKALSCPSVKPAPPEVYLHVESNYVVVSYKIRKNEEDVHLQTGWENQFEQASDYKSIELLQ